MKTNNDNKVLKDAAIIVSGGMDSITMLYEYKDNIALGISFDYGSNHNAKEIPLAADALRTIRNKTYNNRIIVHA